MWRILMLALVVVLTPTPAHAHGWLFRRPVETRYSYYYAPSYYVPSYYVPSYYVPSTVYWVPAVEPEPVVIPAPAAVPFAVPSAAPPSVIHELPPVPAWPSPPIMPRADTATTTARRVSEPYFDLYPRNTRQASRAGDGCSVAFWNLTGTTLRLRIQGSDWALPPGRSLTVDLPRSFSWGIVGRQDEQTRLAGNQTAAEILIRR
jgi:hypothetical protein